MFSIFMKDKLFLLSACKLNELLIYELNICFYFLMPDDFLKKS